MKQTVKSRLLGLLESVNTDRKLVIIDERALRILKAVCSLPDIWECGVLLVEYLEMLREPCPSMDAVYLISPVPSSI